ncbi:hypothetical protein AX15_005797 [Amanita polypyramis BW_CC]|nr:hypothetical protein AX15_005797 [Amanita polypyramis BW_CC]
MEGQEFHLSCNWTPSEPVCHDQRGENYARDHQNEKRSIGDGGGTRSKSDGHAGLEPRTPVLSLRDTIFDGLSSQSFGANTMTAALKKNVHSGVGAPSQFKQTSRKGKRGWRKNVDLEDVEKALEGMRAEEREIGTTLQKTQDNELFQVDVKGDDKIRSTLPRRSSVQLTSLKILSQRSAIPAVLSRTTSGKRKFGLTREEKDKLLRIAKRLRKGPFNSILDLSEYKSGTSVMELSAAVKASGGYDPWQPEEEIVLPDGLETIRKKKVKAPKVHHPRHDIEVPALVDPHQGTSYNPPVGAYQELLLEAHKKEEKRVQEAEKLAEIKEKISKLRQDAGEEDLNVAPGMKLDVVDVEHEEERGEELPSKNASKPKTKQQRQKVAKHLAELRVLAEKAARKRLAASVGNANALRRASLKLMRQREEERAQRRLAMRDKLRRRGLAGQRLGKHIVPEDDVTVQLGEDLSESLRGIKPEGNLFRDRFISLQQRALIEPRVPVAPKKRAKMIEYEKHAWKRFE